MLFKDSMKQDVIDTNDLSVDDLVTLFSYTMFFEQVFDPKMEMVDIRFDKFYSEFLQDANEYLASKKLLSLFFENSTRTLMSFDIAAKNLGLHVLSMNIASSSMQKGETMSDTASVLNGYMPDILVVRHNKSCSIKMLSSEVDCPVVNAGDGMREHPTQALIDIYSIIRKKFISLDVIHELCRDVHSYRDYIKKFREYFSKIVKDDVGSLKIAIVGDIMHSRVARSDLILLEKLGIKDIRIITPPQLAPNNISRHKVYYSLEEGLHDVDIVMLLRVQKERMSGECQSLLSEYSKLYMFGSMHLSLCKDNVLIMHPGPFNRDVEISSDIVDNLKHSIINYQAKIGVFIRMAVIYCLLNKNHLHK